MVSLSFCNTVVSSIGWKLAFSSAVASRHLSVLLVVVVAPSDAVTPLLSSSSSVVSRSFSNKVVTTVAGDNDEFATTAMDFNPVQPSNARISIEVSDDGSSIVPKARQFPNAAFPIVRREDDEFGGKVTWERASQP